jgi:invasion protein IalB
MINRSFGQPRLQTSFAWAALLILLMFDLSSTAAHGQQPAQSKSTPPNEKPAGQEFALRGQRAAREIKYTDWRKVCFKTPGTNMVCRTTISGTWETGQSAVRIDLIEKQGEPAARMQLFLPVGLFLQAGAKLTVDQGTAYRIPYVWCLTNTCIAADLADPRLIKEMEAGQKLLLEVVDSSVLAVSTSLSLDRFAAVRQGPAAQTYEQTIDE